uniref:Retrovirus-related Pol polyprotein from transposon TNT 1-94 n=1 Tax=Tanacetum cinerariifolium TaxID=118510 RepID=A0A699H9E5_TANCI|nr:retrovirus-related Pol polyprotein from transposon TNT 1-94 [Tanacetum cinerariifolium]
MTQGLNRGFVVMVLLVRGFNRSMMGCVGYLKILIETKPEIAVSDSNVYFCVVYVLLSLLYKSFSDFKDIDNKRVLGFGLEQQEGAAGLTVKGSLKFVFESGFCDREDFKDQQFWCRFGVFAGILTKKKKKTSDAQAKAELNKKAHSAVILCLGSKVLREVTGETTAARIFEHIDEFNKIVLDLANIEVKFEDEDLALILLTSLPVSYENFMDTLLYGREALTLKDVMATLNSKEIKEKSKAKEDDGEGLYDHLKRNCPKNNRKKSTGYVKKDEQPSSSGSAYDDSEVMMVMSAQALLDWIMDSGYSYHMTSRLDILFDFLECDGGSVQLGDNGECKIRGVGKVMIQLRDESSFVLHNVRVVLSGIRRDNCIYSLDCHAMEGEFNASVKEKDSLAQVWHKRLGHISEAGLQVLEKQGLFGKKSLGKLDFCENCVLGNSHRVSFDVGRHTTQRVIDYVHSDLWGPSQLESLGGKTYFLSIVNDYSMRVWVYILMFKHEAFGKFKEWKQLVENQTLRTVKKLRTYNGLELCKLRSGLPKTFWAEATCKAAYLINRSPSTAIEKKTPMDMWSGHQSDYEILRIKCVLLGYPEGVKGYRLYRLNDESPKIVTSRNVVFNESVMYKDTLKDSGVGA